MEFPGFVGPWRDNQDRPGGMTPKSGRYERASRFWGFQWALGLLLAEGLGKPVVNRVVPE